MPRTERTMKGQLQGAKDFLVETRRLIWVNYAAMILFFGAEFTQVERDDTANRARPSRAR